MVLFVVTVARTVSESDPPDKVKRKTVGLVVMLASTAGLTAS